MYRYSLLLGLCVALVVGAVIPSGLSGAGTDSAMLKKIASRLDGRTGVISIEATDPVPYVASQPDAHTFVVELRDIEARGFADHFKADPRQPFAAVQVESAHAADGVHVARIRITMSEPQRPKVRSARNIIYVEANRADVAPAAAGRMSSATDPVAATRPATAGPVLVATAGPVLVATAGAVLVNRPVSLQQAPAPQAAPAAVQAQPVPQLPGAPQGVAGGQTPPAVPPRFNGHAVTLDFQGADLRAVLRSFSEISGLNIVLDPTIQGSVDVALRDVPWDQAFDIILRANKLGYITDGTIVRVAPLAALADEEAQRQKLVEAQAEAGELRILTRTLSYAKAGELTALLTATALSKRGTIQIDARTNTIIISDLADRLTRADGLLTTLDRPEPQVEIEARIVETTRDFARRLGVRWGGGARASTGLGNTLPLAFPNQGSITGRTGTSQGPPAPDPGADNVSNLVNLGVGAATSGIGLALGSINGALNLDVELSALESSGQLRVLSSPRVSTQNNQEAEIMQGVQIPIQTVANNTVTVTFRDAALSLRVTPQITAANTVIMRILVENSRAGQEVNAIPSIDTQRAQTQVLVSSGETTVIGGIYTSREQSIQDRTPTLHRIPLLGWLFKRNIFSDESRELLIFITPKIIRL
jgi:type IV pilus assembly protein PilQ